MKAAIYTRQSKFKADSCSLEIQEKRCLALCNSMDWTYEVYQDSGHSAKNTDRPDFQRLMQDAKADKFKVLLVYKLDRVSRNLKDFTILMDELQQLGIEFRSINESFDTTTPIGRAMIALIAVFAQLERETTAERVRDNMLERAKMGIWNGGRVNLGFETIKESIIIGGKEKQIPKLILKQDEAEQVEQLFDWYFKPKGSVRKNVIEANKKNWSTTEKNAWNPYTMSKLLRNPIYCVADENAYEYFNSLGVQNITLKKEWDGIKGVLAYNRTKQVRNSTVIRPTNEWIIAVGEHPGIVPSKTYIGAQNKLNKNKTFSRSGTSRKYKLAGLIKCGKCGKAMTGHFVRDSYIYYKCKTAENKLCPGNSILTKTIEEAVENKLRELATNTNFIQKAIDVATKEAKFDIEPLTEKKDSLHKQVKAFEEEENNLIIALGKKTIPEKLIEKRIAEIEAEKSQLLEQLEDIQNALNDVGSQMSNVQLVKESLSKFTEVYDSLDFDEQCTVLKSLIRQITFDEGKIGVELFFVPKGSLLVNQSPLVNRP